jgi:hypothetical protein
MEYTDTVVTLYATEKLRVEFTVYFDVDTPDGVEILKCELLSKGSDGAEFWQVIDPEFHYDIDDLNEHLEQVAWDLDFYSEAKREQDELCKRTKDYYNSL